MKIKLCEMFCSIQGESSRAGYPSLFLRLTGCNLRCRYCDTVYAQTGGTSVPVKDLIEKADQFRFADHITLTGGEPLYQGETHHLMKELLGRGWAVQLETNGSLDLASVPEPVRKIVDVKTPSSGEADSFLMGNLTHLTPEDEIKFVISDREDYIYSRTFLKKHLEKKEIVVNFSPVSGKVKGDELAALILGDKLRVRLNLQLHKIIWPQGEPKES